METNSVFCSTDIFSFQDWSCWRSCGTSKLRARTPTYESSSMSSRSRRRATSLRWNSGSTLFWRHWVLSASSRNLQSFQFYPWGHFFVTRCFVVCTYPRRTGPTILTIMTIMICMAIMSHDFHGDPQTYIMTIMTILVTCRRTSWQSWPSWWSTDERAPRRGPLLPSWRVLHGLQQSARHATGKTRRLLIVYQWRSVSSRECTKLK